MRWLFEKLNTAVVLGWLVLGGFLSTVSSGLLETNGVGFNWAWVILVWIPICIGAGLMIIFLVKGLTETNAYPPTMDFLRRVRERLQPQFENKLVVKFTGAHELHEERVVRKIFWFFPEKDARVLVYIPSTDGGELDQVEIKDESIRWVVEEEITRPKPEWVLVP